MNVNTIPRSIRAGTNSIICAHKSIIALGSEPGQICTELWRRAASARAAWAPQIHRRIVQVEYNPILWVVFYRIEEFSRWILEVCQTSLGESWRAAAFLIIAVFYGIMA